MQSDWTPEDDYIDTVSETHLSDATCEFASQLGEGEKVGG